MSFKIFFGIIRNSEPTNRNSSLVIPSIHRMVKHFVKYFLRVFDYFPDDRHRVDVNN